MIVETSTVIGDMIRQRIWKLTSLVQTELSHEWFSFVNPMYFRDPTGMVTIPGTECPVGWTEVDYLQEWRDREDRACFERRLEAFLKYPIMPHDLGDIVLMIQYDIITNETAKLILKKIVDGDDERRPGQIVYDENLWKTEDNGEVDTFITELVAKSVVQVEQWKSGKAQVLGWFTGQVMKQFRGKVSGDEIKTKLLEALDPHPCRG